MPFVLSKRTQALIEEDTGLSIEELQTKPIEDIQAAIEEKLGHVLRFGRVPDYAARGSMLIALDETIQSEEIEAELDKAF